MEKIVAFVERTKGPLIPFVADWYPWAYAHHYLRSEVEKLPPELGQRPASLTINEARELIHIWCGLTGEGVEDVTRALADAYLRRWGVEAPTPEPAGFLGTGGRSAALWRVARGRARVGAAPTGVRVEPVVAPQPIRPRPPVPAQAARPAPAKPARERPAPLPELVPSGAQTLVIVSAGAPTPRVPTPSS